MDTTDNTHTYTHTNRIGDVRFMNASPRSQPPQLDSRRAGSKRRTKRTTYSRLQNNSETLRMCVVELIDCGIFHVLSPAFSLWARMFSTAPECSTKTSSSAKTHSIRSWCENYNDEIAGRMECVAVAGQHYECRPQGNKDAVGCYCIHSERTKRVSINKSYQCGYWNIVL